MLCDIDLLMKQKCKDLDNIVDQLKQKVQMNEWHNKFNQVVANVNINTVERKKDSSICIAIASHDLQSDQISIHNERENKSQDNIQTELNVDAIHSQVQQKSIIS
ncbi:hypothetical protein RFI_25274 [Reticulomyxa filosa]|uniref:Uncharacterized protein n=1 Tax=Reticulomyxa filosa TaxID=46433 RepID=X6MDK5_RETFI|nr:hypothetical protein RFI_25274 [Reticulomyxa filosa]|eukprot:ETO12103.1 hypothetical protein RFI_25274 [Reticulomyxa filosa]